MAPSIERQLIAVDDVAGAAEERILRLRPGSMVLSGGNTPRELYRRLAHSDLAWSDMHVFFGDERCVPPDHAASNYRMAYETLLCRVPAIVHRMRGELCSAQQYEDELDAAFSGSVPHFDVVLLGLGADGHTASLFPGDAALSVTDRYVVRVERPDFSRLTLTARALSSATDVFFLVAGPTKQHALKRLLSGADIPPARISGERVTIITDLAASLD
jgi:6-phosphogluconolactonase